MTSQSLTAEFAIEQLKILCQDGDVSEAFPDFDRSSYDDEDISEDDNDDDAVVYRISEDCIADFVGMLAKSDWESVEEFFKFYEFVGYELFTTASDPELHDPNNLWDYFYLKSPYGIKFSHYILTSDGGYFDLYVRARELLEQDQENEKYAYERIKMPAQCDAEWEDITVMDLIPAATAYIWDHLEYLSNFSHQFDELQIKFWSDVICFLAVGYAGSSYHYDSVAELAMSGIARAMSNSQLLEDLFYQSLGNLSYAYSQDCIDNFCDNKSTTSNMLKTIALGAIGDFEKLVDLFRSYGSYLDDFQQQVEDYDWDTETILKAIKPHPNCTDEILEIIVQYESENSDDDGEEEDL
ncbi:hypothetical protein NON20_21075 [Synechocystis sp. B12]|nr:hypothetical protein NON20_21075 [Synechocystis sp. B12]